MRLFALGLALGVSLSACGEPEIVVPELLSVVTIFPAHGSTQIDPDTEGLIYFSHPLSGNDTLTDFVTLECLGSPPCREPTAADCPAQAPAITINYEPDTQLVRVTPDASLQADTCYEYRVAEGLTAAGNRVGPLPGEVRSQFQTR